MGQFAEHAQHVFGLLAREHVVGAFVMAKATGIPFVAGEALELHVALVVLAAEHSLDVSVFWVGWLVWVNGCVGWDQVSFGEVVGIVVCDRV